VDNLLLYAKIAKALEGYIKMTLKSDSKAKTYSEDLGWKRRRLGQFMRDTAIATVVMPLALVAASSALALLMVLLW
jgi:hypothetical protein